MLHCTKIRAQEIMSQPECQLFLYNMLVMKLIDDGDYKNAKEFGDFIILRLKNVNMRTLDHLGAKAMYFVSVAYEKTGVLADFRPLMFDCYKLSCLHHDLMG